ncbi:mismatch-specific DNA-glycosylase [Gemmobacter serpentinus]|uniref:mismatch-specific DNA-glycosylase n=1 Tax=Gemmobacter serpentinus TaxID=2652247 RepID=UPI00124D6D33|nr:mismatch-specific DNA-glycosylase [Gemmobacter serpentinus]
MILPDLLASGLKDAKLRAVFCGTAAGTASARRGHYYAGPGNRFWPMLAACGLTPRLMRPEEDHLLPGMGFGLTDLAKTAFGQDSEIPKSAWDAPGLMARINAAKPDALAFTSLTAARLALGQPDLRAGRLPPDVRLAGIDLWALPSPSGAARGSFDASIWQDFAASLQG